MNGDRNVPTRASSWRRTAPKLAGVSRGSLEGYTIGVTADRRADEQMELLVDRGAECLHGPVITTHQGREEEIRHSTQLLLDHPPDLMIFTTGLGVRGWLEAADAIQLGDDRRDLLGGAELLERGPLATGAFVTVGFDVDSMAPRVRYQGIKELLASRDMTGARVAVQLDGAGATALCDQIESRGAQVVRVPAYRWSLPEDTTDAERLIRAVVDRRVDALTFTAKPAVESLLEIAGFMGLRREVTTAIECGDVRTFCVGPVCAAGVTEAGLPEPFVPVRHRLGAMVQQVAQYFATQGEDVQIAGTPVRVQGRLALIDGSQAAWLTDRERALLSALLDRQGAVLSKPELLRRVWRGAETDERLVEVTVARLRQRLGPASGGIETVVRRGYRVSAV